MGSLISLVYNNQQFNKFINKHYNLKLPLKISIYLRICKLTKERFTLRRNNTPERLRIITKHHKLAFHVFKIKSKSKWHTSDSGSKHLSLFEWMYLPLYASRRYTSMWFRLLAITRHNIDKTANFYIIVTIYNHQFC